MIELLTQEPRKIMAMRPDPAILDRAHEIGCDDAGFHETSLPVSAQARESRCA